MSEKSIPRFPSHDQLGEASGTIPIRARALRLPRDRNNCLYYPRMLLDSSGTIAQKSPWRSCSVPTANLKPKSSDRRIGAMVYTVHRTRRPRLDDVQSTNSTRHTPAKVAGKIQSENAYITSYQCRCKMST
ncbi:hypothetical protein MGYG_07035 [Nannizzia gypsea CBS 118893]|uniref:Uncharacterized protein n=1 Tax=Arthroderma gypseum (strain ATCC MYA-4604 / CBS 118893) TaxID=535722 RepID=E4V1W5_ARTGP|nr:hypothetical protein MGYG_07035 [Nannizzia gypsea CBS 118893]EFR04030.1 hypothetical protein MGYG_07035 [Nannizzia gypsea CBS 118893]